MSSREEIDPIAKFALWQEEADKCGLRLPEAAALATAQANGQPSIRMVLCRGVDERGFVFYTNTESKKANELSQNPHSAMCFYWMPLGKQVRIEGPIEPVCDEEADSYFATRDRGSQISAWASPQSRPLSGRFELEKKVAKYVLKFAVGIVPRPPFWSGFRIRPESIEFWEERPFRLHDRVLYKRVEDGWTVQKLYP